MADQMNAIPKIVVSGTLKTADWQNSTLVSSPSELAAYTQQAGRNIAISGTPPLPPVASPPSPPPLLPRRAPPSPPRPPKQPPSERSPPCGN